MSEFVIRDRVEPAASLAMSVIAPKNDEVFHHLRKLYQTVVLETQRPENLCLRFKRTNQDDIEQIKYHMPLAAPCGGKTWHHCSPIIEIRYG
jgi:hypothetical protein